MASVGGGDKSSVSLNLYPMMDIFSILIVFLLMSFSSDPVNHDVNPAIELPDSRTMVSLDEVPAVSVTKTEIIVNDKKVSTLVAGDVPEAERSQGAVLAVYEELKKLREVGKRIEKDVQGKEKESGTLTMEMDKDHRFQLMKRVMLSAQQAEFITFKLMVAKDNP